jgi:hypothetical protein
MFMSIVDYLAFDIYLQKRDALEETGELTKYVSALEGDLENLSESESESETEKKPERPRVSQCICNMIDI